MGGRARAFVRAAHEGRVVNFGIRVTRDTTLAVPPPHQTPHLQLCPYSPSLYNQGLLQGHIFGDPNHCRNQMEPGRNQAGSEGFAEVKRRFALLNHCRNQMEPGRNQALFKDLLSKSYT